jgi:hypothetical protein
MLKLFIATIFALFAVGSYAKEPAPVKVDKQIICFPIKTLLKDLKNKYGEEPMIVGKHSAMEDVVTAVYVNRETGTYTVIEMDDEAGCVISLGTSVHYRFPKLGSTL